MRSLSRSAFAVIGLAAIACSDAVVDPSPATNRPYIPSLDIFATYAPDSMSADITVTPTGGTFTLGVHAIHFPAYSICRPESSYGVNEWDQPCEVMTDNIDFHVEVRRDTTGRSWLDFTPAVRFVPSDSAGQWVMIYMTVSSSDSALSDAPPILWSPAIGEPGIDESETDPTLRSQFIEGSSVVYRRIKHFSGYNVGVGFNDTGDAVELAEGTLNP